MMSPFLRAALRGAAASTCVVAIVIQSADPSAGADLSKEDQLIIHVLSRLSFGPRPGDLDRVRKMGISAYIEEQLHPEQIADPIADEKLVDLDALEMSLEELSNAYRPAAPAAQRRVANVFERHARRRQQAQAGGGGRGSSVRRTVAEAIQDRPRDYQIIQAKILRALYSERQLHELMVDFWMNHFNINFGDNSFAGHFEQQVIRPHAMGRFEDLLMAVARHPGMLAYLDNWVSSAPVEVVEQRIAALRPTLSDTEYLASQDRLEKAKGLNENYARELMELHTVGIDGGYTQEDIIEVARVLTGWTIDSSGSWNTREEEGVFRFDPLLHVEGDKLVLGRTIKSGGIEEGEEVLRMLAHHPSTARFLATKLVRRFVVDDPPADMVDEAARSFQESDGNIREVLRAIFNSPRFQSGEFFQAKIKKPLELVVSAMRAVNAQMDNFETFGAFVGGGRQQGFITQMGERLYGFETPDGHPDVAAAWINTNSLLKRLEFATNLAGSRGRLERIKVDLPAGHRLLKQMGIAEPSREQIARSREIAKLTAAERAAAMKGNATRMRGRGGPPPKYNEASEEAIIVGTMLGSPQFQKR